MAENGHNLPPLPREAFRRYDETPDERFHLTPRLVTHIDDRAIAAVTQPYREFLPEGGAVLDLMSSWVSHLPPEVTYQRVVGLGMNEEELKNTPDWTSTWSKTSTVRRGCPSATRSLTGAASASP
jgi:hypothetical protein